MNRGRLLPLITLCVLAVVPGGSLRAQQAAPADFTLFEQRIRPVLVAIALFSPFLNLLTLTGSLFMMQVFDRVLGSQSLPTLVALSLIAIAAYAFQGLLEVVRTRVLALVGERIDEDIGPKVHSAVADLPLRLPRRTQEALQPFRDLEAIRSFASGPGPGLMGAVDCGPAAG